RSYRNLSPRTRIGLGASLVLWGLAGPYLSDMLGDKMGFKPTESDRAALEKLKPKIQVIDRDDSRR
ncbi:hypothetical protein B0T16DRAFT_332226, partial [Cercophora newfieldiana]